MQKGDISNEVSPRLVVVFEGLVGLLPNKRAVAEESLARKAKRWKHAVNCYDINEEMAKRIWDMVWRYRYSVDVVTYLGDHMADAVAERMDRENLPVGRVWATEPKQLARRIALMPDIAAIYDPYPDHRFLYGSKGRLLDPTTPDLMGAF